jgi:hypothetical protein
MGDCTDARMAQVERKPIFCLVLADSDQWSVEAEWGDGTIELVDSFKTHSEAAIWLSTQSQTWLERRTI